MITLVIVVLDKRIDLGFEVAGQIVIFQQDAVLQGLVPTLDLALSSDFKTAWCFGLPAGVGFPSNEIDISDTLLEDWSGQFMAPGGWQKLPPRENKREDT